MCAFVLKSGAAEAGNVTRSARLSLLQTDSLIHVIVP